MIIIQHAVQWLNPLRVNISIQNYPIVIAVFHNLSGWNCKHSLIELPSIIIHVA